jgi:multiple sugar transport system substrate-binding protein
LRSRCATITGALVAVSVATGEPPEIIYANRNQIGTFASRGAVVPLTDCVEGEGIDTSVFNQAALDQVIFDGEVYGVPEFNGVRIIQANADLLEQEGVKVEDVNGSDWEAVAAANTQLTRAEGGMLTVIG